MIFKFENVIKVLSSNFTSARSLKRRISLKMWNFKRIFHLVLKNWLDSPRCDSHVGGIKRTVFIKFELFVNSSFWCWISARKTSRFHLFFQFLPFAVLRNNAIWVFHKLRLYLLHQYFFVSQKHSSLKRFRFYSFLAVCFCVLPIFFLEFFVFETTKCMRREFTMAYLSRNIVIFKTSCSLSCCDLFKTFSQKDKLRRVSRALGRNNTIIWISARKYFPFSL